MRTAEECLNDVPMAIEPTTNPTKAFVSYSWSSPTHETWVLDLATRLREDGVDVILDKWDLKPGHDSYRFMETMVTDSTVTKVIMVCDRRYAEKADSRSGGVGTESQIISPQIYSASTQDKFAAAITEGDEAGQAHVPTFYKGRIFFDFRSGDRFEDAYEELLRWLVDRPQHVKPKLGAVPESILSSTPTASATTSRARRADDAIRKGLGSAAPAVREFGDALVEELASMSPSLRPGSASEEPVLAAVSAMRPYARQFSDLMVTAIRYHEDPRTWDAVLDVLERIGRMMFRDPGASPWHSHQGDVYKIVAHQLFLSLVASTLEEDRLDLTQSVLVRPWLVRDAAGGGRRSTSDFSIFRQHPSSLEERSRRPGLSAAGVQAELLKDMFPKGSTPGFESVMQADFALFLRALGQATDANWYPVSLIDAVDRFTPFRIFARAESEAYFIRLAPILGVPDLAEFRRRMVEFGGMRIVSDFYDDERLPLGALANVDHLGSRA